MADYKLEAAKAALKLINPYQHIGLGAGSTIAHLVGLLAANNELAVSLTFTSSSFKTTQLLLSHGLRVQVPALIEKLDWYFDGCDQFDAELNALKSGGGIHTTEKILASAASNFVLLGDDTKSLTALTNTYPLVIEILPQALQIVLNKLNDLHPSAKIMQRMSTQKDGALISDNGNMLVDVYFKEMPSASELHTQIKMIAGVVDHSLFYRIASQAIIAGEGGVREVLPVR